MGEFTFNISNGWSTCIDRAFRYVTLCCVTLRYELRVQPLNHLDFMA